MILREPGSTQPGSYLAFLVRIQTVDPSAFEMPVAPGKRSRGFFIFEEDTASSRSLSGNENSHESLQETSTRESNHTSIRWYRVGSRQQAKGKVKEVAGKLLGDSVTEARSPFR